MAGRVTRADTFTSVSKKLEYFSDFLDDFAVTPVGSELARVTNEKSVNQSIRNLVLTNIGARLFQPGIGCGVFQSLFELAGVPLQNALIDAVTSTIQNYEPRAVLQTITVSDINAADTTQPTAVDNNSIEVTIAYTLINNPSPVVLTVLLRRPR